VCSQPTVVAGILNGYITAGLSTAHPPMKGYPEP
jgi:hypothetical protein